MRIAFLCKRRYMGKDVIIDRYARLYEIPSQLAQLGHVVRGLCLSYHGDDEGEWTHGPAGTGGLTWESRSLDRFYVPTLASYPWRLLRRVRAFAPDIVVGASDIPHVVLGAWLARRLQRPFVADLYDNFESFGHARMPGMVQALRHAVQRAHLVLVTSEPLRDFVIDAYQATGSVIAMPSSVDKAVFHARDRLACRKALGLPAGARLIGTAGGLQTEKGIAALYDSWSLLRGAHSDLHLVLAGPVDSRTPMPSGALVHYLGNLPHERVAQLFCALDVGVICIDDSPFGRYCFPQKAYEMLACELPVVAADVGAMHSLFKGKSQCLYQAGSANNLARRVAAQLRNPIIPRVPIDDWATIIASIEPKLRAIVNDSYASHERI